MLKDNLKELREKNRLTKKQVAAGVEISERAYIAYEYGERDVSTETLSKLADFYGVTTDYLLGREPQPNPLATLNINVDDDRFIEIYKQLPEYAKQIFVDTMAKLAEAAQNQPDKKRHVEKLGDVEDETAKAKDETSSA